MRARLWATIATLQALTLAPAALAEPFTTVDQNPLLTGYGLPQTVAVRALPKHGQSLTVTLNWSNTSLIQKNANESLVVDAESREWRLSYEFAPSERWAVRLDIPYRKISGGSLDHFIEHWHSLFGLPNGDRPALPRNQLNIAYQGPNDSLHFTRDVSGIGDAETILSYLMRSTPTQATRIWTQIKWPTGDADKLLGSGALDASIGLSHERAISSRWQTFGQLGVTYLGTENLLRNQQRHTVWSGSLGFDYLYSQALTLTMQLDGHTAVFKNSSQNLLGNAWILTTGGSYRFGKNWRAQFGVGEDVKVDASPDVTFVVMVGKGF